jgi:peptidoglycan hydrolase-like protein with peptidoglycan-binding domain/anti-sigma regulatory factor (Ser/Thr protein kinase)
MERICSVLAAGRASRVLAGLTALTAAALIAAVFPAVSTAREAGDGPNTRPMLMRGSGYGQPAGSDRVRALQRRLSHTGFSPGPVDGLFGPLTERALQRFQSAAGLAPDGVLGPATRKALRGARPSAARLAQGAGMATRNGSRAVGHLQRALRTLGFAPGPLDGRFGPRTEAAVERFQRSVQLGADGVVGPLTNGALTRSTPGGNRTVSERRKATDGRRRHPENVPSPTQAPIHPRKAAAHEPKGDAAPRAVPHEPADHLTTPLLVAAAAAVAGLAVLLLKFVLVPRLPAAVERAPTLTGVKASLSGGRFAREPRARALGYVRVGERSAPGSPPLLAQAGAITDICGDQRLGLVEVVHDVNRVEAKPLERPGLRYALERIAQGDAKYLVVVGLNDLGGSVADIGAVLSELRQRGGLISMRGALAEAWRGRRKAMSGRPGFPPMRFIIDQPASPDAAGTARSMIESMTADLSGSKRHDLMLLATEVVNNAVRHAARRGDSDIRIEILVSEAQVRLEVRDRGSGFAIPGLPHPGDEQVGGWGLYLVDAIADRWGVEHEPSTVWLEVARN